LEKIVLDTNILIEILKGNSSILDRLKSSDGLYAISSISAMELYFGALNKKELVTLKKFIAGFEVLEINENISADATALVYKYAKSHSLHIADALIASTALDNSSKLLTLNVKDFHFIDGLTLF
jgi:tRNA(fMet)-specific endonuclease VapC